MIVDPGHRFSQFSLLLRVQRSLHKAWAGPANTPILWPARGGMGTLLGLVCRAGFVEHPMLSQGYASILAKLLGVGRKPAGCLGRGS